MTYEVLAFILVIGASASLGLSRSSYYGSKTQLNTLRTKNLFFLLFPKVILVCPFFLADSFFSVDINIPAGYFRNFPKKRENFQHAKKTRYKVSILMSLLENRNFISQEK